MIDRLRKCLTLIERGAGWKVGGLAALMLAGALLEAIGIGLLFPLIQVIAEPDRVRDAAWFRWLFGTAAGEGSRAVTALAGGMLAIFLFKNLFLLLIHYVQARFVAGQQAQLARRLFEAYLNAPYERHLSRNSADLIRNVSNAVVTTFGNVFMGFITIAAECCVVTGLILVLALAEPTLTVGAVVVLGGATAIFYLAVRNRFAAWGDRQLVAEGQVVRQLQQGLHSLKEVKVLGRENFLAAQFDEPLRDLARVTTLRTTLSAAPRLWVESITVSAVLLLVMLFVLGGGSSATLLATLGLFAATAIRLVPSMNRILMALGLIRNGGAAVDAVYDDIRSFAVPTGRQSADPALGFADSISIDGLSFTYPGETQPTLNDLDLVIRKGESIGLVGPSGAGKTTLVDLLLGLLAPTAGRILVDGRDIASAMDCWRRQVGYVPQSVYLTDDTLRRNIAFGIPDAEIDESAVRRAVRLAQLEDVVAALPEGLDTRMQERGLRLSAGQRQRVGIARAMYRDPAVLVLDEATSALDSETEHEVSRAIEAVGAEKTLIIVAHRLTTIRKCNRILFLESGRIVEQGGFEELGAANDRFRRFIELAAL